MRRHTAATVTAGVAVLAGVSTSLWAGTRLGLADFTAPGGVTTAGIRPGRLDIGHLDFTVAVLLLVGLALLLMGLILLLATVADYWMDSQDRRDAQFAARRRRLEADRRRLAADRQRLEADRHRLAASVAETRPDSPQRVAH